MTIPYTMNDYCKEVARDVMDQLSPEERLRGLPPEERLRGLPPEERLRGLPPEERLRGLTPKQIEAYLRGLGKTKSTRKKKSKPKT